MTELSVPSTGVRRKGAVRSPAAGTPAPAVRRPAAGALGPGLS